MLLPQSIYIARPKLCGHLAAGICPPGIREFWLMLDDSALLAVCIQINPKAVGWVERSGSSTPKWENHVFSWLCAWMPNHVETEEGVFQILPQSWKHAIFETIILFCCIKISFNYGVKPNHEKQPQRDKRADKDVH